MYSSTEKLQVLISNLIENQFVVEKIEMRVLELIELDADLSLIWKSQSLLHCLVQGYYSEKNRIAINAILLTKNAQDLVTQLNESGYTPLQVLLNQMINLHAISFENFKKIALTLVRHGADSSLLDTYPDSRNTFLHHLLIHDEDNTDIEALLKSNKQCVHYKNKEEQSPLFFLMSQIVEKESRLHTAILLLQYGSLIDNPYIVSTLFRSFAHANEKEMIQLITLNKSFASFKNADGQTPLHYLIHTKPKLEMIDIEHLIALGSDLFTKDNEGWSLLHSVVFTENFKALFELANKGLAINEKTYSGQTLFHCAVWNNSSLIWDWLFEKTLNINSQDNDGNTALHLAIEEKNIEMIKWFIEHKARFDIKNNDGKTALECAEVDKEIRGLFPVNTENKWFQFYQMDYVREAQASQSYLSNRS